MSWSGRLILLTVLGLHVGAGASFSFADSVASGTHYRVVCHFDNDALAKAALATAEAVWPEACELYSTKEPAPKSPLEIHVYRTIADYEAAEQERTGGRFKTNLTFAYPKDKSAHIALQPPCNDATLKAIGLPWLTRHLIAHEASHLFAYATIPNSPSHPDWLAEGLAAWLADQTLIKNKWSEKVEACPNSSTSLECVRLLEAKGKLASLERIVSGEPLGGASFADYSVYSTLFSLLCTDDHRKNLSAILAEARRLGGGSEYAEKLRDVFLGKMGGEAGLAKLDDQLLAFVQSKRPIWFEVFRSLDVQKDKWVQVAFPEKNAIAWRVARVGKSSFSVSGTVEILPDENKQMNVLLGRNDSGFIEVAFTAGFGVNAFRYHAKDNRWEDLGSKESKAVQVGKPIKFKVTVKNKVLVVTVDGSVLMSCKLGDKKMTGPWGVGAQAGSAGYWRDVKLGD